VGAVTYTHVLYAKNVLSTIDYRLMWWLVAHQERDMRGQPTGVIRGKWRGNARKALGVSLKTMFESQERLKAAGILVCETYSRAARLNSEPFLLKPQSEEYIARVRAAIVRYKALEIPDSIAA
jgi:hypothetical protein